MSSLELFPISQLIYLKLQHTVAKPAEHSDGKRGDSDCEEPRRTLTDKTMTLISILVLYSMAEQ